MKSTGNLLLKQSLLFLMMVVLVLPCTLKKEIKNSVFISTHSLVQIEKPNKIAHCPTFENEEIQEIVTLNWVKKIDFKSIENSVPFFVFYKKNDSEIGNIKPPKSDFAPLFILHEQYLI